MKICYSVLLSTLPLMVFFSTSMFGQGTGTMKDPRDGQVYKTVQIGSQTWMAQNLNHKIENSFAYDNNEVYRKTYGLLYTWEAANKACPSGWHLPSNQEFGILLEEIGGYKEAKALKSDTGWDYVDNDGKNGTNSSGFSALPGGEGSSGLGINGVWWLSTKSSRSSTDAYLFSLTNDVRGKLFSWDYNHISGQRSVRCIKD